ncbi:hypothetical protein, partial [Williamsia muralis]
PPPPFNGPNSGPPSWSNQNDGQPAWTQAQPPKKSKKPWIFGGIGAIVVLLVIAGIAGGSEEKDNDSTAATSSVPTVTAPPSTVTVEPTTSALPTRTSTPAPVAPTTTSADSAGGIMPAVVCMNLQAAQNLIQDNGVFFSRSEDATGEDRMQLDDSNWIVVSQTPEPGTPITEGDAILSVVKIGEPSPC